MSDEIERQLATRRADLAFMERLHTRMTEDAPLLERLKDGECSTARLIASLNGGALLVYECECGARLTRTREQAEADALPAPVLTCPYCGAEPGVPCDCDEEEDR